MIENRPLTAIRGIAALAVVLFHLAENVPGAWPPVLAYGEFGVDVFFILSGYILTAVYADMTAPQIGRFWANRVARIFPLHLAVLAALAVGTLTLFRAGLTTRDPGFFDPHTLPYHASLTFVWFGLPVGWNGPAWSLSVEWAAYLLFPAWLFSLRRLKPGMASLLCLVLAAAALFHLTRDGVAVTGGGALARGLLEFALGSALRRAAFPAECVRVLTFAGERLLDWPPLVWLGRISYSIYLLHAPFLMVWIKVAPPIGMIATSLAFLAALLIASQLSYVIIEVPARQWLRSAFGRIGGVRPSRRVPSGRSSR
jgi:peptidoglycan/LPS O-acetylase OafA/YrhL